MRNHKWLLLAVSATGALAVDLLTKRLIVAELVLGEQRRVAPGLVLEHVHNSGVAFGMLSGRSSLIGLVAVAAVGVILAYVVLEPRAIPAGLGGGLLLGGSLGNLVERLTVGHVTDFLKLPYWPNFNLADVFIVAGVGLISLYLVADLLRPGPSSD